GHLMVCQWLDGVIVSLNDTNGKKIYFVQTATGPAVIYPRVHESQPEIRVGAYVRVNVMPAPSESKSMEVDAVFVIPSPIDHSLKSAWKNEVEITCNASFASTFAGWYYFDNPFLGRLAWKEAEIERARQLKSRWMYRVKCRRGSRECARVRREKAFWTILSISASSPIQPSSSSSNPSLISNSTDDGGWTTVILTGSYLGRWYASCGAADPIFIPGEISGRTVGMERGAFYRIQFSTNSNGEHTAHEMESIRIRPSDVIVSMDMTKSLRVWCTTHVIERRATAFMVQNEMIGTATLPFIRASNGVRVGIQLRTLCYRVKNTNNPTHWMVLTARSIDSKMKETFIESTESIHEDEWSRKEQTPTTVSMPSTIDLTVEDVRDRRVLSIMKELLAFPSIISQFEKDNRKGLETIRRILERDRQRYCS
ncbi:hypothetical protein PFISCL1PPCAC_16265, partial [Pristionchus fissidentatus]